MNKKVGTKRHEVASLIERAILTGQFKAGSKLTELKIAAAVGVSQGCVREALLELEGKGLVVKYPNRGSFVIDLSEEDLVYIYQLRRELEPMACALAAMQIRPERLKQLQQCLDEMRDNAEERDYLAFTSSDFRFHCLIWEAQPNHYLEKMLKSICRPLFAYDLVRRYASMPLNFDLAIGHHRRVLKALQTRDASLVSKVVRRMVERFFREDLAEFQRLQEMYEEVVVSSEDPFLSLSRTGN